MIGDEEWAKYNQQTGDGQSDIIEEKNTNLLKNWNDGIFLCIAKLLYYLGMVRKPSIDDASYHATYSNNWE